MIDFKLLAEQYKSELLDRTIPFWLNKSQDAEFGGHQRDAGRRERVGEDELFFHGENYITFLAFLRS